MRSAGITLVVVGVLFLVISLAADALGIGEGTGVGWKQYTGAVVGAAMAIIGIVQLRKGRAGG